MIHSAALSGEFPLAWFFEEFKDVFSWSGKRKTFLLWDLKVVTVYEGLKCKLRTKQNNMTSKQTVLYNSAK